MSCGGPARRSLRSRDPFEGSVPGSMVRMFVEKWKAVFSNKSIEYWLTGSAPLHRPVHALSCSMKYFFDRPAEGMPMAQNKEKSNWTSNFAALHRFRVCMSCGLY